MLGCGYVEKIHDNLVVRLWPGTDPIAENEYRSRELVESAVNRPFQTAFGQDIYSTFIEKGAALFHSLVANHAFHNGNKRTAVIALDHFLIANALILTLPNDEMYLLAQKTASYRQRGVSHEDALREIVSTIIDDVVSLRELRTEIEKYPQLRKAYRSSLKMCRAVREDRLNKLIR